VSKELSWPVPEHMEAIFGNSFKKLMRGWMSDMAIAIERPIVFWYLAEDGELRSVENKRYYDVFSPICSELRKDTCFLAKCRANDEYFAKISMTTLRDEFDHLINTSQFTMDCGNIMIIEAYVCERTNLTEWMIPVVLGDNWLGVFITGQFIDLEHIESIKQKLSALGVDLSDDELINLGLPDKEQTNELLELICEFTKELEEERRNVIGLTMQNIYEGMLPYLRGAVFHEEPYTKPIISNPVSEFSQLTGRFRKNRTRLFESVIVFRKMFGLCGVHLFKPLSKVDGIFEERDIDGANLDKEELPTEDQQGARERGFKQTEYRIDHSRLKKILKDDKDRHKGFIEKKITEPSEIISYLKPLNNHEIPDLTNSILLVYANAGFESYPLAYILFFESMKLKQKYLDECERHKVLSHASTLYLANWYVIYADYQSCTNGLMNQFVNHELSNTLQGMRADFGKLNDAYEVFLPANLERNKKTREMFEALDIFLDELNNYIPSAERYTKLLSLLSDMTDITLLTRKPYMESFTPNRILYNLCHTFKPMFEDSNKRLNEPSVITNSIMYRDIQGDSRLFELIANNLISNALKYSYIRTRTSVNSSIHSNGKFRVMVTSYGSVIPDKEIKQIFVLGYRTEGAKRVSQVGVGMGLYLVKRFAELHGGTAWLESNEISNYHISHLKRFYHVQQSNPGLYSSLSDEKIRAYREAYEKIFKNYPQYVKEIKDEENKPHDHQEIMDNIEKPTACNVFIVEIPQGV